MVQRNKHFVQLIIIAQKLTAIFIQISAYFFHQKVISTLMEKTMVEFKDLFLSLTCLLEDVFKSMAQNRQKVFKLMKLIFELMNRSESHNSNDKQTQTMPRNGCIANMMAQTDQAETNMPAAVQEPLIAANRSGEEIKQEEKQRSFSQQVSEILPNQIRPDASLSVETIFNINERNSQSHQGNPFSDMHAQNEEKIYRFVPESNACLGKFKITGQKYEYMAEDTKLRQVISKFPVSKECPQSIKFKITHSETMNLYIGLAESARLKESHSAMSRDGSTISFRPHGNKRMYVLNKSSQPRRIPNIVDGDIIEMRVNYKEEKIVWLWNGQEMDITKAKFGMRDWHPFVTFKCRGDIVEIV